MKNIVDQFRKESKTILSDLGLKSKPENAIGLDLGARSFRAARIRHGIKDIPLKDTLIKDLGGLKDLSSQMGIGPDETVSINFTGEQLTIKRVSIHSMPLAEIGEALKWELKEQLHIDIDKSKIKYSVLGERQAEDETKKIDLVAAVYNEKDIEAKVKGLKDMGLNVQAVLPSEVALAAYINSQNLVSPDETAVVVNIGSAVTTIFMLKNRKLSFSRSVAMGGDTVTEAMTGTLVSDKGRIELSREDAEKIKREQGISDDIRIMSMMRPMLEKLVTEIKRSMDYCERQFEAEPAKKIVLAGGGARLKGLKEYLAREMELEVLDPLPEIAEAVGLGLSSASGLNMLPAKFKQEKGRELKKVSARMFCIAFGLIFLFSYGLLSVKSINLQKELDIYKKHLETVQDIRIIRDKVVVLGSALNTVSSRVIKTGMIMKELSNIIVPSATLGSLVIKDIEPHVEISGVVLEGEDLSEFMSNLENSPLFEKIKLVYSEANKDYSRGALDFKIRCNLE